MHQCTTSVHFNLYAAMQTQYTLKHRIQSTLHGFAGITFQSTHRLMVEGRWLSTCSRSAVGGQCLSGDAQSASGIFNRACTPIDQTTESMKILLTMEMLMHKAAHGLM
jgi:hypothetical protein